MTSKLNLNDRKLWQKLKAIKYCFWSEAGTEQSLLIVYQNNLQEGRKVKDATNPLSPPQEKVSAQWNIQQQCKLDTAAAVKGFDQAACGTSAVAVSMAAAGATFSGQAFISDLTIQAPNRGSHHKPNHI